jgi:hypothetical protein
MRPIMSRERAGKSRAGVRICAAALAVAFLASGCSSSSLLGASQPQPPPQPQPQPAASAEAPKPSSFRERMTALFSGGPAPPPNASSAAGPQPSATDDCPTIEIRSGASTYAVGPPGADPTATTLRYQATIARTARECTVLTGTMTVKVGVQGRVILGPAGGPGVIEVPIRLALVQEGVEPKTIWTKAYRVAVSVPPGQSNVPFVHVEEDMSFLLPKLAELNAYVIYVGFDPTLVKEPEKKPEKKPPPKKPRAAG